MEANGSREYQQLVEAVQGPEDEWPEALKSLKQFREDITMVGGVAIYKDCPIIPIPLRPEVLATLHSGHQGVTGMWARASTSVWWPGMWDDISQVRSRCRECDTNTPSQPKEPPVPMPEVLYPFQQVCMDYFSLNGKEYLVTVDRYSVWPSVHLAKTRDSKELTRTLRLHCETFGVPEVLTSDGGPQFVSRGTQEFLETWGITHRVSSAYVPHGNLRAELGVKSMK